MVRLNMLLWLSIFSILSSYASTLEECDGDSDCRSLNSCKDEEWVHKDLWPPEGMEILGTLLIIIFAALSNAGGIGGGAIMTTILIILFSFNAFYAVPLSQAIVFAGSLMTFIMKMNQRHPKRDRPLIDYKVSMHFAPMILLGTSIGVLVNAMFPEWLILLMLTAVVVYVTINTFQKGAQFWKKETAARNAVKKEDHEPEEAKPIVPEQVELAEMQSRKESEPAGTSGNDSPKDSSEESKKSESRNENEQPETADAKEEFVDKVDEEKALAQSKDPEQLKKVFAHMHGWFPWINIGMILGLLLIVILYSLFKGGRGTESLVGIDSCSGEFAGLLIALMIILLGFTYLTGRILYNETKMMQACDYPWWSEDLKWDRKKAISFPICSFFAGIGAGLLGIGGGMILGPFMLAWNVNPQVSGSTSSFIILFSSAIACLQFGLSGTLALDYALWVAVSAIIGAGLGVFVLRKLVIKSGRPSLVVITLGLALCLSAVAIPAYGIYNLADQESKGKAQWGFSDSC